jgi:hypothetical protein
LAIQPMKAIAPMTSGRKSVMSASNRIKTLRI